jgi:pantoate--beta-alanine ligase
VETRTLISVAEAIEAVQGWRRAGETIALVPTMGALHNGHLDLVRKAQELARRVIVSIFVNPTQFGPNEDFAQYPRTIASDLEKLSFLGVDAVFSPTANEVYPINFQTWVSNDSLSLELCGKSRPGHFGGVCTVVMKLFQIAQPDYALFGKKDYQQYKIIQRMATDLNVPVTVIGCETIREPDGLALSSRNRRLSVEERIQACAIYRGLAQIGTQVAGKNHRVDSLLENFRLALSGQSLIELEYAEIRRAEDLSPVYDVITDDSILLTAAKVGSVRLIDNIELRI